MNLTDYKARLSVRLQRMPERHVIELDGVPVVRWTKTTWGSPPMSWGETGVPYVWNGGVEEAIAQIVSQGGYENRKAQP